MFLSDVRLALHGFPPNSNGIVHPALKNAGGEFKRKRVHCPSLVVTRNNEALGGTETYMPPRLLQGIIPSALLESFHF